MSQGRRQKPESVLDMQGATIQRMMVRVSDEQ